MSAYIVPKMQIAVIARWFYENTRPASRIVYNQITSKKMEFKQVREVATMLAQANVDSFIARYEGRHISQKEHEMFLSDCEDKAHYPHKVGLVDGKPLVIRDPAFDIDPASLWNLCCNLDYQSCEVEEWISTDAYWVIQEIKKRATEVGMNTESAKMTWGWVDAA